jgi:hypothetical protein
MLVHHEDSEWYQMIFRFFLINTETGIEDFLPKRTISDTAVRNAPLLIFRVLPLQLFVWPS